MKLIFMSMVASILLATVFGEKTFDYHGVKYRVFHHRLPDGVTTYCNQQPHSIIVWNGIPRHAAIRIPPGQSHPILFQTQYPVAIECLTEGGAMNMNLYNTLWELSGLSTPSNL
ncbi:hypothetical protein PGTUg99_002396 [Puccinia graminis f. sp. tritici]|nr:hypothetical protein PGTUg99_002396 [Puccinia graminis f. sp. tritici]